ncbi:MAG: creatininase family protein [Chloroflexi bacterium]|nr:creatininase family protein [Chloroflexota bacterium]
MDITEDIIRSVYRQGFRRVLLLNGHGGNDPVRGRIYEVADEFSDLRIAWYVWWDSHGVEAIAQKNGLKPYHASWLENFSFTRVAELPRGEKSPPHVPGLLGAEEARKVYGDGVFGGAYQVDDAIMQEIFDTCVADVVQMLKF